MDRKLLLVFMLMLFFALGLIDLAKAENPSCDPEWQREDWIQYSRTELENKLSKWNEAPANDAVLNSYITKSYFELMDGAGQLNELNLIGYFYSHASFHLGRIARYRFWISGDLVGEKDKSLITGKALNRILRINSSFAAKKLMKYSEDLYHYLSWSLYALKYCGRSYTLSKIEDPNLKAFYQSNLWERKLASFIRYEQSYLQDTLYRDIWVAPMVQRGFIDEMRWIPFPTDLDRQISFKTWCQQMDCQKSSYNLELRIQFDLEALKTELQVLREKGLGYQINRSYIYETNDYFLSTLSSKSL